ncbi:uncharacterized protein N0V89_003021 [Didymosphaeria variabile]|uniref:Uncharacterized protein n=1 Tax=Didymosphaeria variabile TaxID=1932322 RepID=A0A9W8XUK7_9PLEO|nr:uncharacterized protein N0V89_003021 [Didymosphaeria variabile]KAJ4358438.1 hypothetical protein N0V89_003021 [Didymosphaeria variabile]
MADHLNLAAACISVIAFPHVENPLLPLITVAAGALPGRWFNPARVARAVTDISISWPSSLTKETNSLASVYQNITINLTTPKTDTTIFSAKFSPSSAPSPDVLSNDTINQPIPLHRPDTVDLPRFENDTADRVVNLSSSNPLSAEDRESNVFSTLTKSLPTASLLNKFFSSTTKSKASVNNHTIGENGIAATNDEPIKSDTIIKNDVATEDDNSAMDDDTPVQNGTIPEDDTFLKNSTVFKDDSVFKNDSLYNENTSTWMADLSSLLAPAPNIPYSNTSGIPRRSSPTAVDISSSFNHSVSNKFEPKNDSFHSTFGTFSASSTTNTSSISNVSRGSSSSITSSSSGKFNTFSTSQASSSAFARPSSVSFDPINDNISKPYPPPVSYYASGRTDYLPLLVFTGALNLVLGMFIREYRRLLKNAETSPALSRGTKTERVKLKVSDVTTVIETVPLESQLFLLRESGITESVTEPRTVLLQQTAAAKIIETVPLEPHCVLLRESGITELVIEPRTVLLQQTAASTITETMPLDTEPVSLQQTMVSTTSEAVPLDPKFAPFQHLQAKAQAETEPVDPKPVPLKFSKITEKETDPVSPSFTDTVAQADMVRPTPLGMADITIESTAPTAVLEGDAQEHTCFGCGTVPFKHECLGCRTTDAEQTDSVKQIDCDGQTVSDRQTGSVEQEDSIGEVDPVEPTNPSTPTPTQILAYEPFQHANSLWAHQQRTIDSLDLNVWPYAVREQAPEGWQNREDFTYPETPKPVLLPHTGSHLAEKRKGAGYVYRQDLKQWERIERFRENEAQRDYEEYVLGPGPATRSVERTESLFRPERKQLTEAERIEKNREHSRIKQKNRRQAEWLRHHGQGADQADNGQGDASANGGELSTTGPSKLDPNNPRNFTALGYKLQCKVPLASEDRRLKDPPKDVLRSPPAEVDATSLGEFPQAEAEEQDSIAPARLIFKAPPASEDKRNVTRLEENRLLCPRVEESASKSGELPQVDEEPSEW